MSRGGYRADAGRPFGARDRMPRKSVKLDRLKSMSPEYDTNEYLITNEARIFGGNALELMTAMYKAEQLPVRVRLYAASKAVDFESDKSGRTLEEIREEVRRELMEADKDDGWVDKLMEEIERHRRAIHDQRDRLLQSWVMSGELTERQAALVRTLWGKVARPDGPHIDDIAEPAGAPTAQEARINEIRSPSPAPYEDGMKYGLNGVEPPKAAETAEVGRLKRPPTCGGGSPEVQPNDTSSERREEVRTAANPPKQESLFSKPGIQAEPAEVEVIIPTRGSNGSVRWITRPK